MVRADELQEPEVLVMVHPVKKQRETDADAALPSPYPVQHPSLPCGGSTFRLILPIGDTTLEACSQTDSEVRLLNVIGNPVKLMISFNC